MVYMILSIFSWFPLVGAYLRSFSSNFYQSNTLRQLCEITVSTMKQSNMPVNFGSDLYKLVKFCWVDSIDFLSSTVKHGRDMKHIHCIHWLLLGQTCFGVIDCASSIDHCVLFERIGPFDIFSLVLSILSFKRAVVHPFR